MPALQCSAVKCMYNKDNLCSKGDIQVKGDHAADSKMKPGVPVLWKRPECPMPIHAEAAAALVQVGCSAHDCTYNRQEVCQADHVQIDGSQACICEETCCGTFRCE